MTTRRSVSWFLTEQGRKICFAVVTGTGLTLTAVRFCPHTFLIDKYREIVHHYSNGKPVELPKEIQERHQKCLDTLKISDVHRKLIKPFSVFGFDLFHAGSTSTKFGSLVGIPTSFTYKTLDDVEKDGIQVNLKPVDLTTDVGKKLGEALIMPERVQEFAICREILMTHNNKVIFESTYPFVCIFFVYNLTAYINRKFNLYSAHRLLRLVLYSLTGSFGLGTYFLLKDATEVYYETCVDKELCELGQDFVESGVLFYEKILARNQALRELMGSEGQSKYSKLGNENFGLRQPRIALVHRKLFFESQLKETNGDTKQEDLSV
ncbi:unnamed protein product [Leptidea sinapis]|uniref:Transmembrane protein 177 n=1 Tax=Leptidea sinapis TaxID=189913 RepID=A0A5E4R267_9NEOP|nr:unnamed protein product [Leptidea sinapis]